MRQASFSSAARSRMGRAESKTSAAETAAGKQQLSGEPTSVVGGEKDCHCRNIRGLCRAAKWRIRDESVDEIGPYGIARPVGRHESGIDGVHTDSLRPQLLRQNTGQGIDRCLVAVYMPPLAELRRLAAEPMLMLI